MLQTPKFFITIVLPILTLFILACGPAPNQAENVTNQSSQSAYTAMKARMNNTNEQVGANFFTSIRLNRPEARLMLTVSDLWYATPNHLQDSTADDWINVWSNIAGNYGWTGLARVQFVDSSGKQVAYKSRSIRKR